MCYGQKVQPPALKHLILFQGSTATAPPSLELSMGATGAGRAGTLREGVRNVCGTQRYTISTIVSLLVLH